MLNEITELDKKVNLDDLMYKYKGNTRNEEFNEYDNALDLIDKISNGEIKLADANNQNNFKVHLGEIKKGAKNQRSKKIQYIISNCFTKQGNKLLNFLMVIL